MSKIPRYHIQCERNDKFASCKQMCSSDCLDVAFFFSVVWPSLCTTKRARLKKLWIESQNRFKRLKRSSKCRPFTRTCFHKVFPLFLLCDGLHSVSVTSVVDRVWRWEVSLWRVKKRKEESPTSHKLAITQVFLSRWHQWRHGSCDTTRDSLSLSFSFLLISHAPQPHCASLVFASFSLSLLVFRNKISSAQRFHVLSVDEGMISTLWTAKPVFLATEITDFTTLAIRLC